MRYYMLMYSLYNFTQKVYRTTIVAAVYTAPVSYELSMNSNCFLLSSSTPKKDRKPGLFMCFSIFFITQVLSNRNFRPSFYIPN